MPMKMSLSCKKVIVQNIFCLGLHILLLIIRVSQFAQSDVLDVSEALGDRGLQTQMFKGQGGHKTKTAKGHLT